MKERIYDLRVFSNSYIISENLAAKQGKPRSGVNDPAAREHIKAYLNSVEEKFNDYKELILINPAGELAITGSDTPSSEPFPAAWLDQLQMNPPKWGKPHFTPHIGRKSIFLAEAVRAPNGDPLGILAAKVNIEAIRSILKCHTSDDINEIYLLGNDGRLLVSSNASILKPLGNIKHTLELSSARLNQPNEPMEYVGHHDRAVIGMIVPVSMVDWMMVAEMEKDNAYTEITELRRVTIFLVGGLMLSIGTMAYTFGNNLVKPVRRLSDEAAVVSSGNLDVNIPVTGLSEVSYLTQVFNHMVASLRSNREELSAANNALRETNAELHQISITDGLTGLYNRKHIMEVFDGEIAQSKRYGHHLAALMLDIDYFKEINDSYGHQVGDTVMRQLAESINASVRNGDFVGRYGGEEFLAILYECNLETATITAERIRKNIANHKFIEGHQKFSVTISIGIAEYPVDGEDAESLLRQADNALYQAKADGRNRVATPEREGRKDTAKVHVLPARHIS